MSQVARNYKLGWWPTGSIVDRLDFVVTTPLLKLETSKLVEGVFAVPGTWFGIPPFAWAVLPPYVGCLASDASNTVKILWLLLFCLPSTILGLVIFFRVLERDNLMPLFTATKYLLLPCAIFPPIITHVVLGARASHAVALILCSWLLTQTFSHLIKISARRTRPVVSLAHCLNGVKRHYPALQKIILAGETAFQSFPSGDAGGAMVYSVILLELGIGFWAVLPALLSSLGRVFFHAHHILDVVFGSLIGYFSTKKVVSMYGIESGLNAMHTSFFMFIFVALHILCRKFISFEIPAEFRNSESIYGRRHK